VLSAYRKVYHTPTTCSTPHVLESEIDMQM